MQQQQQQQHPFNGLFFRTTWVSRYQKGQTSLDLNEATRDDGVLGCSGISWTICKQSAPLSRKITTSTPHRSIFTDRMLFLTPNQQCQSNEDTRVSMHTFLCDMRLALQQWKQIPRLITATKSQQQIPYASILRHYR